jgi:hypothetical protein
MDSMRVFVNLLGTCVARSVQAIDDSELENNRASGRRVPARWQGQAVRSRRALPLLGVNGSGC